MNDGPAYTDYRPRWHRPRMSTYWWVQRWSYVAFILRELSSLFIAWFVLYLLLLVQAVSEGEDAYKGFLAWSKEPVVLPSGRNHSLAGAATALSAKPE